MEFVTAARAMGASWPRIMFRHVLRNALAPVLVPITFGIAAAIFIESGLSYLGFGASPPNPSWGTLLKSGRSAIEQMWWLIVFPGLAIFLHRARVQSDRRRPAGSDRPATAASGTMTISTKNAHAKARSAKEEAN